MRENDSIATLDQGLLDELVDKDSHIIECAKVINGSFNTPQLNERYEKAGQLAVADSIKENCGMEGAGISVADSSGRVIHLRNITFPGRNCGIYLAEAIDSSIQSLQVNYPTNPLEIGAFLTTLLGSSHLFAGANGRTALGTSEVLMRRMGQETYRTSNLTKRDINKITQLMSDSTFFLLPSGYNPADILADPQNYPDGCVFELPYMRDFKQAGPDERYQIGSFVGAFAESIVSYTRTFNPSNLIDPVGQRILKMSQIMRRGLKERNWAVKRWL